jgi:hypothetical protein
MLSEKHEGKDMAVIYTGRRFDIAEGEHRLHHGTADYLAMIGATIQGEPETVPDDHVDRQGNYIRRQVGGR